MLDWIQANAIAVVVVAVVVGLLLTAVIMHRRRNFGFGRVIGKPEDPERVRRQNPPD
jgi:preprotein translocase subunit SecG